MLLGGNAFQKMLLVSLKLAKNLKTLSLKLAK
jgi:hypothetical protein